MNSFIALTVWLSFNLFAAHEHIKISTEVVSAINLQKLKDLDFGEGLQGDPQKVVQPTEGAEFTVIGEPHRAYSILLPASISMKTSGGSTPSENILVNDFRSYPEKMGKLDCDGKQSLRIGATRAALLATQKSGNYLAPFTVTVLY